MEVGKKIPAGNLPVAFGIGGGGSDCAVRARGVLRRFRVRLSAYISGDTGTGHVAVVIVVADVDSEHLQKTPESVVHADLFDAYHRAVDIRGAVGVIESDLGDVVGRRVGGLEGKFEA